MKLNSPSQNRRRHEQGFFLVLVMFIFISIMMIYGVANHRRLANLKREIKLVEQKQQRRWERPTVVTTNQIALPPAALVPTP